MRSILAIALVLTLAMVPAVQAQQVATPARAEQPSPRITQAPMPAAQVDLTPIHAAAVEPAPEAVATAAARETSARNVLALVGAVVVVVALIAFLR